MRYYTQPHVLVGLALVTISCWQPNACLTEFKTFEERERPMIAIERQIENSCSYEVDFVFSPTSNSLVDTKGQMTIKENTIWFRLFDPATKEFKFFDFGLERNQILNGEIEFLPGSPFDNQTTTIKVLLEDKVQVPNDLVYIFRAKEIYYYEDFPLDVVYFVSKTKGVIGSYISTLGKEKEHYLYPKGDVLENYIDYSKKESSILL